LLSWFHNYLTDRHKKVTILGKTSRSIPVLSGVPQGWILGPLLFLVYVNDLPEKSTTSSVALFADDTKCYHAIRTTDDVKALQRDLDGISQWCRTWRMNLNETKCGVLKVTRNLKPCSHLTISTTITQPTQRSSVKGLFKKILASLQISNGTNKSLLYVRKQTDTLKDFV
jgi:hypothetical protein